MGTETENSDVCVKESNDSEIEPEKIDKIEDHQSKSEASNLLVNATEKTSRDMDEEEIIKIQETEIDDPPQEEGTESKKSNEIEEDKPNSDDGKFKDANQVDGDPEKEAG